MYVLMMVLMPSTHVAMLASSSGAAETGTMIGAWPGAVAPVVVERLGDTPGSELGGEPRAAVLTFTKGPQVMVPGSEGGV